MIQLLSWAIMQDANEDLRSKNEGARVRDVQSESETHSVMSDSL